MNSHLLSIDVDAHLEKLATRSYRSPAHYPVELVRSALKRGAEKIDIHTDKRCFEIRDNGHPLDLRQLQLLESLMDTSVSDQTREQAVIDLQDPDGIGLLAVFSSSPTRIDILTSGRFQEHFLSFDKGNIQAFKSRSLENTGKNRPQGTRITLFRKGLYVDQEYLILREYCRGVAKEIRVNHQLISGKSIIRNALVSMRLSPGPVGVSGEVGIPARGDICRIWLLDQGIPQSRKIIAPWKGYIFDAALEFPGEITGTILNDILGDITTLYQYLIEKYKKFPPVTQSRIEELVFRHHQLSQSRLLVDQFPVFFSLSDRTYFTLPQVQKLAEEQIVAVIPESQQRSTGIDLSGKTVFRLNQQQIDTLVNHFDIPIQFLQSTSPRRKMKNLFFDCRESLKSKFNKIFPGGRNPVPPEQLSTGEKLFLRLLREHLTRESPPGINRNQYSNITFMAARRFSPFMTVTEESSLLEPRQTLRIHRHHPLIKKAVRAVEKDPRNINVIEPLLY